MVEKKFAIDKQTIQLLSEKFLFCSSNVKKFFSERPFYAVVSMRIVPECGIPITEVNAVWVVAAIYYS